MKKVKLHVNESRLQHEIGKIQNSAHYLQHIADGLKGMGAEIITIQDLKNLMLADGSPVEIKKIILRGKILKTASGLTIAKEAIYFDDQAIRTLSTICRNAPASLEAGDFYEIVDGKVKLVDGLEDELRPRYTLLGSERQQRIISKMETLAAQINALRTEIGADHAHSPMRDPAYWFLRDTTTGKYGVDVYRVSKYVNP
jgi:hypothetical protein